MKFKSIILNIALFFSVTLLVGCAGSTSTSPRNYSIPNVSDQSLDLGIKAAAKERGWQIIDRQQSPVDKYVLELNVRSHFLKIQIQRLQNQLVFTYLDSRNLNYNSEFKGIHKKYNNWINNLYHSIKLNLNE